ncbi:hypothetical protein EB796_019783 [Bugula neritina]|uniref:Uncharacterized protein n=1 Tax=Bugula neritina TaxID=10212 RepID=A0A7J7J8B5_BUGNE|nr:hypothetical protein EB796_019783 [Bugula neritina]
MVELAGEDSIYKQSVDNNVLIVASVIVLVVFAYLVYRVVSSLRAKEKAKEDKRLAKQQKKEKSYGAAAAKKNK